MAMFLPPEFRFQVKVFLFWTSFSFYLKYNYDKFMALILAVFLQWGVLHTCVYDSSSPYLKNQTLLDTLSIACIFKLLELFLIAQRLFLILVSLENLWLYSCLECKFLLRRGYYVGDKLLRKLLPFIRYFIILFVGGQYIMFCESLCRVSSAPQIFTTLFVDASRLQYICTKVVIEVRKWKRSCEIVSAMF